MKSEVKVFSPASVTNVGSGFDIFGFAIDSPGDFITVKKTNHNKIKIVKIHTNGYTLPLNPKKNTATRGMFFLLRELNLNIGIDVEIDKRMPFASGLGSSAASAVGGVFALNCLLGNPFKKNDLLKFAAEGEKAASGKNVHLDNIAACLFGGFILVQNPKEFSVIQVSYPTQLTALIIHPHIELHTKKMRSILGKNISLQVGINQWANTSAMIFGLMNKDYDVISKSINDFVAEPKRKKFIPFYDEIKSIALENGALGFNISGAGPSMFAFIKSRNQAKIISDKIKKFLDKKSLNHSIFISKISKKGVRVIK